MASKYEYLKAYRPNPWFQDHLEAERDYSVGIPFATWSRRVVQEYRGFEEPRACACGGQLWWKGTIAMYKCPSCGALQAYGGEYLR
ncbi:hypothetical protein GCM10010149_47400 [Nonomuraea roseoviolacea subsp. roseoviolacea]